MHRFAELAGRDPGAALRLWRGDPELPEVDLIRLGRTRLEAQKAWLASEMTHRDVAPELESLVAAHPLDEPLIALLIRALRRNGSPGRALDVFERARRRLADELGADPSPELAALHLELLRDPRGNLPAELSSFVGRAADVRAVRALLGAHRLVTLTGPGGSGKTRLSVEVAARLPGGVWRAELAPVRDRAELPQAILTALDPARAGAAGRRAGHAGAAAGRGGRPRDAARPGQLRASDRGCRRGGGCVVAGGAGVAAARDESGAAGSAGRGVVPGRAAGVAATGCGRGRGERLRGGAAAARPGLRLRALRPECGAGGADLPCAGRDAARDRAGRGPAAYAAGHGARGSAGRPVPSAHLWQPGRVAAPSDAACGGRLELGPAFRGGATAVAAAGRVPRRGGRRRGGAGLRGRSGSARCAGRQVVAGPGSGRALPDVGDDPGVRLGASRRGR